MSNEHITDEQIVECALSAGFAHDPCHKTIWATDGGIAVQVTRGLRDFARAILALRPAAQPVGEPVYWEWRHLGSNPYAADFGQWSEWKRVERRSALHTVEDALAEFRAYIAQGYKYELRALYTTLQPVAVPDRVPMTDEDAKKLLNRSDLLDMFLHIGWYSAPRKNFDQNALLLLRAIEAHHGITTPKADK